MDRWLPELADRKVLRRPDGPLDDVVPAARPLTVLDLLSLTGFAVLGVLLVRAGGKPLEVLLRKRLLDPLRMSSTGFTVRAEDLDRLPPAYRVDGTAGADGGLVLDDPSGAGSAYATAPSFPAANGGLVSTLPEYLAFARMLRAGGVHEGRRLLSERTVQRMTSNQLTPEQRAASPAAAVFLDDSGWGLGVGVTPDGRFGWAGYGTSCSVDPATGRIVLLATQRMPPSSARSARSARSRRAAPNRARRPASRRPRTRPTAMDCAESATTRRSGRESG